MTDTKTEAMVERVADALFLDGLVPPRGCPMPSWADQPAAVRDAYLRKARAAIAAMREPTPEMIKAAGEALYMPWKRAEELAEQEKFAAYANDGKIAWQAMHAAALSHPGGAGE